MRELPEKSLGKAGETTESAALHAKKVAANKAKDRTRESRQVAAKPTRVKSARNRQTYMTRV